MRVTILDGYVDEPSNFGVPPFISPYPRYLWGAIRDAGHEPAYVTIEQVRAGHPLRGDALAILSGPLVPGKYLRGMPISEREIVRHASAFDGVTAFGGPLARFRYYDENLVEPFDWVSTRDLDASVYDFLTGGAWGNRDHTFEEWDRWAVLGAEVVRRHPDFPDPLIAELDTSKGCVRYVNGGCSFCIEPNYGKPKFRDVDRVLEEVRALGAAGVVNFRLGGQADFFSYGAIGVGETLTPRPNVRLLERLMSGMHAAVPDLKVLHTDNADPAVMVAHPEEAMAGLRILETHATPGTVLSFGLESADPIVAERNNLNIDADGCLEAIRMVNAVGRTRGENGMPKVLPGLNFVAGLEGESRRTFELNLAFLRCVLDEDLWVRRINIRQVRPVRREFAPTGLYREFRKFKEALRTQIDHVMLQRVVPTGTVLRDVYLEIHHGRLTYGRQVGSYPILVGLPYRAEPNRFVDVVVTDHGQRSVTAVEHPLDVNSASMEAIEAIPGIGRKRAARIVRSRPFASAEAFADCLDDAAVAERAKAFVRLAA